ncbi:MAG: hypothetical protein AMXMBFR7_50530 [Planctomycetota bacterium]
MGDDTTDGALFKRLSEAARERLAGDAQAQAYLREQGVADETVWARYRLGATGPALFETFSAEERERLVALGLHTGKGGSSILNAGILIPTFDPQAPEAPVGFVKQAFAQNKHAAVGRPSGLACAADVGQHPRIIITDNPLLMLRLTQRGAKNVVLVEEAEVLGPLADGLREREVLVASYKKTVLTALAASLKDLGVEARTVFVTTEWQRLDDDAVAQLGIEKAALPASKLAGRPRPGKRKRAQVSAAGLPERIGAPTPVAVEPTFACEDLPPPAPASAAVAPAVSPLVAEYPERPELVSHDARMLRAIFKAGDAQYEVETALDVGTKLEISVERLKQKARDRFDLAKEAQRKRFATSAALRTGVPCEVVEAHLIVLLDAVRELQAAVLDPAKKASTPTPERMSEAERDEALALLHAPDLLDRIAGDLEALGWVGEENLKRLLFLVAVSRKLPNPLHAAQRASEGSGKTHGQDLLCTVTPPEDLVRVSALTEAALYHQGAGLRHKLLVLSESDVLDREVIVQLRVLLSEGALRKAGTQRDAATGHVAAEFLEAQGPVAFLTGTAHDLDREILDRCYDLALDESPAQTARVLEAQRKAALDGGAPAERARRMARLRNLQRLVEPLPVVIPFADRIEFPATSVKHRREQQRFLRLIEASALLHQQQRLRDGEALVADERDFEIARRLVETQAGRGREAHGPQARALLALLRERPAAVFTMRELESWQPDWTRHAFRVALAELQALEYVLCPQRGRGRTRAYRFEPGGHLQPMAARIRLRAVGEVGEAVSPTLLLA